MEEMQHAQLDALMVEALVDGMSAAEIEAAIDGYWSIGRFIDEGLKQQTLFDLAALETAAGRILTVKDRERFVNVQHQANRWTYLGSGMSHPKFVETMGMLNKDRQRALLEAVPMFS
jgi:hypothetical protein